jgi:uncharacterized protein YoxC
MSKLRQLLSTLILSATLLTTCADAQSNLTQVRDSIRNADGTPFNGTVVITWNGSTAGSSVSPLSTSARIYNGALSVLLVPSTTATAGAFYQVVYHSNDGTVTWTETWSVPPSTNALSVSGVRTSTTPGSGTTGSTGGSTGGSGGSTQYATLPIAISQVSGLSDNLNGLNNSVTSLTNIVNGLSSSGGSSTALTNLTNTVNGLSSTVAGLSSTVGSLSPTVAGLTTTVNGLNTTTSNQGNAISSLNATVGNLSTSVSDLKTTQTANGTAISTLNSTVGTLNTTVTGNSAAIATLNNTVGGLNTAVTGNTTAISGLNTTVNGNKTAITGLNTTVSNLGTSLTNLTTTVNALGVAAQLNNWAFIDGETPSGTLDGTNASFTLSQAPSPATSLEVYRNGLVQTAGIDYTVSSKTITFLDSNVPVPTDVIQAYYRAAGSSPVANYTDSEAPSGTIDGVNLAFTLANTPSPVSSLKLFKNGMLLQQPGDYTLSGSTITFVSASAPQSGDAIVAYYRH